MNEDLQGHMIFHGHSSWSDMSSLACKIHQPGSVIVTIASSFYGWVLRHDISLLFVNSLLRSHIEGVVNQND